MEIHAGTAAMTFTAPFMPLIMGTFMLKLRIHEQWSLIGEIRAAAQVWWQHPHVCKPSSIDAVMPPSNKLLGEQTDSPEKSSWGKTNTFKLH